MASKKGVYLTIGILAAITIASFVVWSPQGNWSQQTIFEITDHKGHLDGIKAKHGLVSDSLQVEFDRLVEGDIEPDEYTSTADASSTQIKAMILELINSDPPSAWYNSYEQYIEALRSSNSQIRETIVYAKLIQDGKTEQELDDVLINIQKFKQDANNRIDGSDASRPDNLN